MPKTQRLRVPLPDEPDLVDRHLSEQHWAEIERELQRRSRDIPHALQSKRLLTEGEIAERLNLVGADVERQVRRLVKKSSVPFYRVSRSMRLSEEQFDALLEKIRC